MILIHTKSSNDRDSLIALYCLYHLALGHFHSGKVKADLGI